MNIDCYLCDLALAWCCRSMVFIGAAALAACVISQALQRVDSSEALFVRDWYFVSGATTIAGLVGLVLIKM